METAGLVIGVAGLLGLFTSCLEAINIVQSYHTSQTDSHTLNTRFKVAKTLFEQWGLRVGIEQGRLLPHHHSGLDDENTSVRVMELLHIII
ncbi:prion-inhibition and propagation, helo domain-containing protein, partial [Fusarium oxysporum f. sp. albedinis]